MIADETFGFCSTHATASAAMRQAGLLGQRAPALHPLQHVVAHPALDEVGAAVLVGGPASPAGGCCARLVLAGQHALRDRRPDDLPDAQLLARSARPRPR